MLMLGGGAGIPARLVRTTLPWLILVPVAFRLVMLAQALWTAGTGGSVLWMFVLLHLVPNVAEAAWIFRRPPAGTRLVPAVDAGFGALFVLVAAPFTQDGAITSITWTHLMGTVMICALLRGALAGASAIGGAVLLHTVLNLGPAVGLLLTLATALVASLAIVGVVGASMRFALGFGEQQGRAAERERHRRDVHDTVLQVMESFAIPAPADELDPAASLDRVRRTARAQAMRIRISLEHESAEGIGLHQRLRLLAAEMAAEGLRAEVVIQDDCAPELAEETAVALHDSAREALRNTLKHSGTRRAVVSVEEIGGGVSLTVRDHGAGFDVGDRRRGFGLENSIIARMAEIGGFARIESSPGLGTRVVLLAPSVLRLPVG
ncbi:sensor histidine kinase [Amycolatopsis keratiniphila]|uniref:ATP-binding protein n=1 Tax=Amycolatopsis keratiniphila subsp. keratiniphila TaxID=227715 RepID=A0A1W2LS94_9PSEU|nr:ATP-binding protein [Amycolatopsis keratiniphila]ONF67451.1 ATP-binding protein [Amycolatopsis keratiniphila subsp. keratiniphila]